MLYLVPQESKGETMICSKCGAEIVACSGYSFESTASGYAHVDGSSLEMERLGCYGLAVPFNEEIPLRNLDLGRMHPFMARKIERGRAHWKTINRQ
jgi:hypothetical protein